MGVSNVTTNKLARRAIIFRPCRLSRLLPRGDLARNELGVSVSPTITRLGHPFSGTRKQLSTTMTSKQASERLKDFAAILLADGRKDVAKQLKQIAEELENDAVDDFEVAEWVKFDYLLKKD